MNIFPPAPLLHLDRSARKHILIGGIANTRVGTWERDRWVTWGVRV